jgi:DNA repair ATPase RecN
MDINKTLRFSLFIIIIIVLANFLLNLFSRSEISKAKDDINKAQERIETAIVKIDSAQLRIYSLLDSLDADRQRIAEMNRDFNLLNSGMQSKINKQSANIKPLLDSVRAGHYKLHSLKKELKNLK